VNKREQVKLCEKQWKVWKTKDSIFRKILGADVRGLEISLKMSQVPTAQSIS